jgi:eukaryotic-like serine/threonine-protein kinase
LTSVNPEAPGAIAHYNPLERIGQGGLGEVYRARDTKLGRTVALKLVPASSFGDAASRELFLEDARAAATLSHPNIATLFDVGEYDGGYYLAYEFASGVTLRQEMSGRAANPRRAVELAVQIADALADGHSGGVLHSDLRPDTIFVTQKGSAKVLDFGMSRWTRGGKTRTRAATAPASLGADAVRIVSYMSPEQAVGESVDPRSDVFSLGVVLYEMLTGRNPFTATSAAQTVVNVTRMSVPTSQAAASASADLDAILGRAMAKEIDKRHQSAASFSAELRSVGAMLDVRAGDSAPGELLPLEDDGGSARWWLAAAAVLLAVGVLWWVLR